MTSQTPLVTGVDFVSIPTSDLAASMDFRRGARAGALERVAAARA